MGAAAMDWDKLRIFHAVAAAGSFTHAGQTLSLSQSAVSRQIGTLEEELGLMLFQRHARGLTLTEEGELLFGAVADVLLRLAAAEEALKNVQETPTGALKVTATHGIGTYWLLPRVKDFIAEHPGVDLHMVLEDRELDLAQRQADIALRMRAPVQADLIQRKLFTVHYHIYASRDYLARNGAPESLAGLRSHPIVVYGETAAPEIREVNWLLDAWRRTVDDAGKCAPVLRVNNLTGILHAVEDGMGLGALPDFVTAGRPDLVRLLPDVEAPAFDVHLVYCDALRHSKRVAAFRDFLLRLTREWQF